MNTIYRGYPHKCLKRLKRKTVHDSKKALDTVRNVYRDKFKCEWLEPFGFNNTYTITVRKAEAQESGWKNISDLAGESKHLKAGFTAEFAERPDGYPGLKKKYGIQFKSVQDLDPSVMYEAVEKKEVDVICAFATDGRIAAYHLQPLADDGGFFPPYDCAPVVRDETLSEFPQIREVLTKLAGTLNDSVMQRLNYKVDEKKRSPRETARSFLVAGGYLKNKGKGGTAAIFQMPYH